MEERVQILRVHFTVWDSAKLGLWILLAPMLWPASAIVALVQAVKRSHPGCNQATARPARSA